jgi:hypothetical protein
MTEKQQILYYYIQESDKAIDQISKTNGIEVDSSRIWQILTDHFDFYDNPVEIIYKKLDSDSIYDIIVNNYLHYLSPITEIEIDYTIIPEDLIDDSIIKGIIKLKGEVWEVHKHDKDEFPSNPHAHNYEYGLKLHLGTGVLYKKKNMVGSIRKKDLLKLRNLIEQKFASITLPTLKI